MNELTIVICVVSVTMLILFWGWNTRPTNNSTEGYGTVLGQLAPYAEQLNECFNECNRSDPNTRLLAQGNINCGVYCESIFTEMAQNGTPPSEYPINNNMTLCEKQCDVDGASENEKRKCLSMCYGHNEVAQWCKELWCPYSLFDEETCMKHCTATWNTNNNQVAWKWGMSK